MGTYTRDPQIDIMHLTDSEMRLKLSQADTALANSLRRSVFDKSIFVQ